VWKSITRSAVGTSHLSMNLPCQDFGGYLILDEGMGIAGAVADGAGSAKLSEFGAKCAVKTALEFIKNDKPIKAIHRKPSLQKLIFSIPKKLLRESPTKTVVTLDMVAQKFFTNLTKKIILALQKEAENLDCEFSDLACTFVAFVATPDWVIAMQIGDGFIVVRHQGKQDYQLLFQPDKGEYANETTFVTSSNALQEMQVKVVNGNCNFICASTDGLERLAIRVSDWMPFPPFFKPLEEFLRETPEPEQDDEYILSFLNSERLNARTDDDKTLLICLDIQDS
jgi:hypothetical protein